MKKENSKAHVVFFQHAKFKNSFWQKKKGKKKEKEKE